MAKKKKSNKMIIIGIVALVLVLLVVFNMNTESWYTKSSTAAVVNGDRISTEEVEIRYNLVGVSGQQISKDAFLSQLIEERLLLQEAEKAGYDVSNTEVQESIDELLQQSATAEADFKAQLEGAGVEYKQFKEYYKNNLIVRKFLNDHVFGAIEITDAEIEEYYDANSDQFMAKEGEIRAKHILVKTEEEALGIIDQLDGGADFEEIAKEVSIGPSAVNGGELGFFGQGQMVKEFEDAAFALRINEISDPVQTQFGWHIIKREPNKIYSSESRMIIEPILKVEKQRSYLESYIDDLEEGATIEIVEEEDEEAVEDLCLGEIGVNSETVIFYHADWCGFCKKMAPIVEELEEEGYDFYWAETSDENIETVQECYSDVLGSGVPEFICAGSKEVQMGAVSKEKLKAFADACKG